jgi:coenzyme F420-reducing hydrogenase gamma subunit
MTRTGPKPKLAVWKFASCDGCQLSLLDCEDELLAVADAIEIAYFLEATRAEIAGPYDVSLVEGSITTRHDIERIRKIRKQSRFLVSIGACATAGGFQAVKNFRKLPDLVRAVYPRPELIDSLPTSTAIKDHVPVDFELRGCPINKYQLLEFFNAQLNGRKPNIPTAAECLECKRRGTVCVMVTRGTSCLGPVTQSGCGSLCPSHSRGCYGCFGPAETANTASLANRMAELGTSGQNIGLAFRSFNANAEPFRNQGNRHDRQ